MKSFLRYFSISAFFFILGFMYEYHVPKIKIWTLVQIEELSDKHLPIRVYPKNIKAQLWPPGLAVTDIRILPKADLAKELAPVFVKSVSIQLRPQSILSGDLKLSEIIIEEPTVTVFLQSKSKKSSDQKTNIPNLKELLNVPIQEVLVNNATLQIRHNEIGILSRIEELDLSIQNKSEAIFSSLDAKKIFVKKNDSESESLTVSVSGSAVLDEKKITIRGIKIKEQNSFLIASGEIAGDFSKSRIDTVDVKSRSHFELERLLTAIKAFSPNTKLPEINGLLDLETNYVFEKNQDRISANIKAENLKINQFQIGGVQGQVDLIDNILSTKALKIKNSSGLIEVSDLNFKLKEEYPFTMNLAVLPIELRKLLIALDVGDTPLQLFVNGKVPCSGNIKPTFTLTCNGRIQGTDTVVYSSNPNKRIVSLKNFGIEGQLNVDTKQVSVNAKINIGNSKGEASAIIEYEKGFHIKYNTSELNFADVETLGELKIEGKAAIQGETVGDSSAATFNLKMKTNDFWFEDYAIGQATGDLSYKSGTLTFNNVEGRYNTTRFFTNLEVNLNDSTIQADGRLGYAEARDIQQMFSRKVQLPFEFFGNASAKLSVRGPLEFNKLTYELDSSVFRGTIANEPFDEARFHVTSQNGNVKTQNVYFKKGLGVATMTGEGYPTGQINTEIKGRNFRIEDLKLFNENESLIQGAINFDMSMKGHVLSPDTVIRGSTVDTFFGRETIPPSSFFVTLNRNSLTGAADFLNDTISMDFAIPFNEHTPFKFKAKSKKWNFSPLFALLSKESSSREFETELTSEIDLHSVAGGFWKSSGKVRIETLRIRRGNLELYNPSHGIFNFDNGVMNSKNFQLQGDNTLLKIEANNSRGDNFNVSVNGKVEMSLLSFLTPFLADLKGVLSVATQLHGNKAEPQIIGSAFIERGYAKLKEFPHAFENIKADLLFNQQKILVNSIQSNFAGGVGFAEGSVEIKGLRKFPTTLNGRFEKINLAVPQGISTQGSGNFKITGEWFPFLLSGNYNISGGTIIKNFDDQQTNTEEVKRSLFLPDFLLEKGFSALKYDINTNFNGAGFWVRNNLVETEIRGQVRILGTTENPGLLGEITTPPGGKFMFRDVPFEITDSNIKLNNPNKIHAILYAQATTRVKDYDVNLLLQGTQENYRITLRSTPPLAEQEIISLLALGYTSEQLELVKSDQQIDQNSYEIGSAILQNNPLGNDLRNKYGVSVRFGSAVDDTNQVAPKITVSKQWSQRVNTSASRTVGASVTQDVKVEYQLNKNVSVIGSWEGKEYTEEQKTSEAQKNQDILGLDLQYRQEFK